MRSDSYLDPENHSVLASFRNPKEGSVDTVVVQEASKGIANTKMIENYKGNSVLSSYSPLEYKGLKWIVVAEMAEDEALASVHKLNYVILALCLIIAVAIAFIALWFARSILALWVQSLKKCSLSQKK